MRKRLPPIEAIVLATLMAISAIATIRGWIN